MSEFLAYRGPDILLAKLLHLPHNSFTCEMDLKNKKSIQYDSFGMAWYKKSISPFPAIYTSQQSALSDTNLKNLSELTESSCIFMHQLNMVTGNEPVQPFRFGNLLFMKIGEMSTFHLLKKDILNQIQNKAFDAIKGHSDNEYIFAFFLSQLDLRKKRYNQIELDKALRTTIDKLTDMCRKIDRHYHLSLNIAVTNFDNYMAMRFMDHFTKKPDPMYYALGDSLDVVDNEIIIQKKSQRHQFVIISTKILTKDESQWELIPENHILSVSSINNVSLKAII